MSGSNGKWSTDAILAIYSKPLNDLLFEAHTVHRAHHAPNRMHMATLLSIKTGACPEDCGYCSQSGHHNTGLQKEPLMDVEAVLERAREAKAGGASRFCMGAAWRNPPDKAMPALIEMIKGVRALGLETCMTLGMLDADKAKMLADAGLGYYNHNIDTSPSYYEKVVTTRCFSDRLDTLENVRQAGINVCSGGIVGLGETRDDRVEFLQTLANLPTPPESVPINQLIPVEGTPLARAEPVDGIELVRTIATARILMPKSVVRLTAGRHAMSDELQAMCFFAGANSVFLGEKLLTEENSGPSRDASLFEKLGITAMELEPAC
ncbi:biotin synthase [Legionella geestiana]|uniref:Biotin synthase n=1 Tax=Legionella geestiana TaxID=45065 RepID=A0A0W0TP98_9GAMM|nr:biotin synthase BioB [Legionella geestiana]KTC97419.1 biotin synthase [Legionella geestiana]QBS11274.1 biotin synthase BioB [Legionella geestiana]QDQ40969.1 biotin synthase BioB [Legionella geestiana]STX54096.1 biotin synthetase [Legionella geestiana]